MNKKDICLKMALESPIDFYESHCINGGCGGCFMLEPDDIEEEIMETIDNWDQKEIDDYLLSNGKNTKGDKHE